MSINEQVLAKFSEMSLEIATKGKYDRSSGGEITQKKEPSTNSYVYERKSYYWKKEEKTEYLLTVITSLDMKTIIDSDWREC